MPVVSKLTDVGDRYISGEYDEYTIPYNSYTAQFNGTNQYLTVPSNTAFDFGTGDFTIECWVWTAAYTNTYGRMIVDARPTATNGVYWNFGLDNTGKPGLNLTNGGASYVSSISVADSTWHHVAVTRQSGTIRMFVDGVSVLTPVTGSETTGSSGVRIGMNAFGGSAPETFWNGYISNLRIVKGTAVYTAAFNPLRSPLTNITNTSLLTCQNPTIIDNSTNAFTITNNNTVTTSKVTSGASFIQSKQKQLSNGDLDIIGEFDEYTLQNNSYAVQFNGTSQYLSLASNTAFDQNGAFTFECWVYKTSSSGSGYFMAQLYSGYLCLAYDSNLNFVVDKSFVGNQIISINTFAINTWHHVAMACDGTTTRLFVNGTLQGSAATTGSASGATLTIGRYLTGTNYFPGYISNVRFVKGTALYTSNFTPPISPLTAITNTSLLTCQNPAIVDNSTNAFTITNNNTATTSIVTSGASFLKTKQKQFSSGDLDIAGKFDEYTMTNGVYSVPFSGTSGEYLTVPSGVLVFGTNNFTVESWIYTTSYNVSGSGGEVIIDNYMSQTSGSYSVGQWTLWINGSGALSFTYTSSTTVAVTITGTTVTAFAWNHVAVVRNGTIITLYLNGASVASGSYAGTIGATGTSYIGGQAAGSGLTYRYAGSISNLRVLNNNALYTANFTVPSRPLTINSNTTASFPILPTTNTTLLTCQLPYMEDNSTNGYIIGNPASLTPSIVPNKFYSAVFDGGFINTMIQTPNDARYNVFGVSASTIEFYYYSRSTRAGHLCIVGIGNQDRAYIISNGASLTVGTAIAGIYNTRITAPTSIVQYRWYHVALTRVGSTVSLYLDGVLQGTSTASFYSNAGGVTVTFGTQPYGGGSSNDWYIGQMSNIRILNGTALYTGNFTPPTDRLTAITNTVLLTLVSSAGIVDETGLATLSNPRTLPYNAPLF